MLGWVLALGPEWYQQWSFCEAKAFSAKLHSVRRYEPLAWRQICQFLSKCEINFTKKRHLLLAASSVHAILTFWTSVYIWAEANTDINVRKLLVLCKKERKLFAASFINLHQSNLFPTWGDDEQGHSLCVCLCWWLC